MSDYTKLTSEVLRLLCQQKSLPITGKRSVLIARLKAQPTSKSKRPSTRSPAARSKRQKTNSTQTAEAPTDETEEILDDPAEPVYTPNANEMGEEPHNDSQPSITVDQITTIVSAIVESKMATLASPPAQQAGLSTAGSPVNLGDPTSIQQLLATLPSNSRDIAVHVDEKNRKTILQGEYVDFVSLLHENSTRDTLPLPYPYPKNEKVRHFLTFIQFHLQQGRFIFLRLLPV